MSISLHGIIVVMIYRYTACVIRCWTLSLCLNVLDNSTHKCNFLRMCYKGMFWCYMLWHPVCRTVQSALHFTPWHTCSFWHKLCFSGKHSVMLLLLCEDFTRESPAFYHIMLADMLFANCLPCYNIIFYNLYRFRQTNITHPELWWNVLSIFWSKWPRNIPLSQLASQGEEIVCASPK